MKRPVSIEARKMREIRKAHRLRQDEFAAAIGRGRQTISALESGMWPVSLELVDIIAARYNKPRWWFFVDFPPELEKLIADLESMPSADMLDCIRLLRMFLAYKQENPQG